MNKSADRKTGSANLASRLVQAGYWLHIKFHSEFSAFHGIQAEETSKFKNEVENLWKVRGNH